MQLRRLTIALLACLVAPPLLADTHPNADRGLTANTFGTGDIDNVNSFNGNLTLLIPIGGSYPVGGNLSYGLTLAYSGKPWDITQTCDTCVIAEQPQRRANAGFGWMLSLGRLESPSTSDSGTWLYVSPDGSEHAFFPTVHTGDPQTIGVWYTRDGSYLRLKDLGNNAGEVELPSGLIQQFGSDGELVQMRDRFGNFVNLTKPDGFTWQLTDSDGRTQIIHFDFDPLLSRRVSSVELSAVGGATATYSFGYTQASLQRPCVDTDPQTSSLNMTFLTSVTLPDGSTYSMPDYYLDTSAGCRTPGLIKSVTLPTLGKIAWTYQDYTFPTSPLVTYRDQVAGVATRTTYDAAGNALGTWSYTTQLEAGSTPLQLKNSVTTPLGHRTELFYSVAKSDAAGGWSKYEYGLPLTHYEPDGSGTRFLSSRAFNSAGTQLRSTYVRYERDNVPSGGTFRIPQDSTLNQRLASSRTVYHDDGGQFADTDLSDFDGLGHYRTVATDGNFGSGNVRSSYTRYNSARGTYPSSFTMLPSTASWVLGTFDLAEQSEGGQIARRTFVFDPGTGWLSRTRIHAASNGTEAAQDLVIETLHDHGNLTHERDYGGDVQPLGTGTLATLALPSPQYEIRYTTESGTRATAVYTDGTGTELSFKLLDQTIDPNTGLPTASRDSAGIQTTYEYDLLGRLRFVKPETGHDGWAEIVYNRATSPFSLAQVQTLRRTNGGGVVLAETSTTFDGLGRVVQEQRRMADGSLATRQTQYDGMGWVAAVSEWGNPAKVTQYLGYDPFGRPATIRPPDGPGHDLLLSYTGVSKVVRSARIGTSFDGTNVIANYFPTTETYDRQGRLFQIKEESDNTAANRNSLTTYTYDVGHRIKRVNQSNNSGSAVQNRFFTYDQRGFLLSESHPEKGASGGGTITYSGYDARGHASRRIDGPNDLTFTFDRAERLTEMREGSGLRRLLKTFTYGTSNVPGVRSNGKLETASRFNYLGSPFNATAQVIEGYTYGGRGGRVSQKTTQLVYNGANSDSFSQSYTYNDLGLVSTLGYPVCTFTPDCPATLPRTVSFNYSNGWLTAVPGFATAITYHPNGLYRQVVHANGTVDTQANDPDAMPRPASLGAAAGTYPLWSSGNYAYDGAGNVVKTGNGYFLYDRVSRLVDGHLFDGPTGGGNLRSQIYSYDAFGNLTAIGGDAVAAGRSTSTSPTTNRLTEATYDAAGDLLSWNGNSFEYDALGMNTRLLSGAEDWRFVYTADDERLWAGSVNSGASYWALRDLDSKVLREYSAHVSWTTLRDYVYRDGQLLASEGTQATFTDVPPNSQYAAEIESMWFTGVTGGCGPGVYCPTANVTRAQMAVFLLNAKAITPPLCTTQIFNDVPCSYWAARWINELARLGVTGGCGGGNYCPENTVTTSEMAVFLVQMQFAPSLVIPDCVAGHEAFPTDMPASSPFCKYVEEVNRRGIDTGCGPTSFCPSTVVTRGRMAPLLARTFSLPYPDKGYTKHYHLDHLGTPRLITSNASSRLAYHAYFPFGEEITGFNQDAEQMKFTGHERDFANASSVADDVDYMHARFYKPLVGRLLSPERIGGQPQRPQSWNRFTYAFDNPMVYVDPTGYYPIRADQLQVLNSFFGTDFSRVELHNGSFAHWLTWRLNAEAVTIGNDVFLSEKSEKQILSGSIEGIVLLAHEMGHTMQAWVLGGPGPFLKWYLTDGAVELARGGPSGITKRVLMERSAYDIGPIAKSYLIDHYTGFSTKACYQFTSDGPKNCTWSPITWERDLELIRSPEDIGPVPLSLLDLFLSGAICLEGICT